MYDMISTTNLNLLEVSLIMDNSELIVKWLSVFGKGVDKK